MKTLKHITIAAVLITSLAQVSLARTGTIVGGRTGTIVGGRTGTIVGGRTGTIVGGRTANPPMREGIIPTQSNQRFRSTTQEEMFFNLLFWLNNFVW